MPKHSGLLERKGRFYLNIRVPKDLRSLYGKKEIIRKSLGTSDRRNAISLVRFEAFKIDAEFAEHRRKLKREEPTILRALSDREAHQLVLQWFVGQEKLSEKWFFETVSKMDESEMEEVLDNLQFDEVVFSGGSRDYLPAEATEDLDAFLKSTGLECPKDSVAYRKLVPLFTKARLENVRRSIARMSHKTVCAREPLFREVYAHTELPISAASVTVGGLVDRFLKAMREAKRSGGTLRTYEVPARLLREFLGEKTPVAQVTKAQVEQLFDLLRKAPSNATKRYRGLSLEQAVQMADKKSDSQRLGSKTLENYYNNIVAIFHFAVEKEMITKNPAKDRWLRASFEREGPAKRKALFTAAEMNQLFRAPPFALEASGSNKGHQSTRKFLRSGRAWVPLISLFHGLRCNEAAQLYTEDVKKENRIPFFEIREEREDGSPSEKRLKTKQSKRRVPLHPELLKMGFLAFVEERRSDTSRHRLFPDLSCAATGYFSDSFGKWFGRFVKLNVGEGCKATFHAFRHQFRDALTEAGVSIPDVEKLGGWELMNRSSEREYGSGPSLRRLQAQVRKVKFSILRSRTSTPPSHPRPPQGTRLTDAEALRLTQLAVKLSRARISHR